MSSIHYWAAAVSVALTAFLILRGLVRTHYRIKGHLTPVSSAAEWLMVLAWVAFSYTYLPADWPTIHIPPLLQLPGWFFIVLGTPLMLSSMAWLGLRRSHGLVVETVIRTGPYRYSRNPQIVGFAVAMIGVVLLWPSWHMLVSLALLGFFSHLMVMTEEEHLQAGHGEEYRRYCARVPRYLKFPARHAGFESDRPLDGSASNPAS